MKENEVSYRILYIDGERIISEESVIGSNSDEVFRISKQPKITRNIQA